MKPKSVFHTLSPEDRDRVVSLCGQHTYHEVLEMIAKPRSEGGLDVQSSESALCRFYVRSHPLARKIQVDAQLVEALDESFFEKGDTYLRAIIFLLQERVFTALSTGTSIDQVTPALRHLTSLRRDYHKLITARKQSFSPLDPPPEKYMDPADDAAEKRFIDDLRQSASGGAQDPAPGTVPAPKPAASEPQNTCNVPPDSTQNPRNSADSTNSTLRGRSTPGQTEIVSGHHVGDPSGISESPLVRNNGPVIPGLELSF
jgi:hypothetical protein